MRYTIKKTMAKLSRDCKETLVYVSMWLMLALAPVVVMAIKTYNHVEWFFDWSEVFHVWVVYAVFLVPFLIHNYLLVPIILYRHRARTYFIYVTVLVLLFFGFQRWIRPERPRHFRSHRPERVDVVVDQKGNGKALQRKPRDRRYGRKDGAHVRPPFFFEQMDVVNTIVLVLIFGMNVGVKLLFKQSRDRKRMEELERRNLEQQLEYLKFQVNPHFFMNTLNNIHALVDIEPEKAKESIVVLSRMMRYLLYDGNSKFIPLEKELSFIRHYIQLMRMRYTDHVRIAVDVPEKVPEAKIPPLVLFTFVENAFKHGITYQHDCFIELTIRVEGRCLLLRCANSRADKPCEEKGGVGLANLCQRLSLIYGNDWEMTIDDEPETYEANLRLPLTATLADENLYFPQQTIETSET